MTWEVRKGDCLDPVTGLASLTNKSVDVVITDPPYSQYIHRKARSGARAKAELRGDKRRGEVNISRSRDLGFEHITVDQMEAVADQFERLTRRWVLVFCDVESSHLWKSALTSTGLDHIRILAWVKPGAAPQFTGDRPASGFEAIVCAHAPGRKRWNGGGRVGIYEFPIVVTREDERRVHTTQKPEALMEALVRDFTDPGDLILDPFAGSGTTGVAAKRLGRQLIGWERDPQYHAIAQRRIDATQEQLELGALVRVKTKQAVLF